MSAMPSVSGPMASSLSTGLGHAQDRNVGMWETRRVVQVLREQSGMSTHLRGVVDFARVADVLFEEIGQQDRVVAFRTVASQT